MRRTPKTIPRQILERAAIRQECWHLAVGSFNFVYLFINSTLLMPPKLLDLIMPQSFSIERRRR